jgi:cytidylate kinase
MKREYDFSKAVRGKFFRKGAELRLPIYLGAAMHRRLERIARRKGKGVGEVVTQLLEKDIELLETLS